MGGSGKGKNMKSKRKSKSRKSESINNQPGTSNSNPDVGQRQSNNPGGLNESKNKSPYPYVNVNEDMSRWNCYTEDELEELLFNKLGIIYNEAFQRLLALGYHSDVAQQAILINGYGFGTEDILSNIVTNSLACINCGYVTNSETPQESKQVFKDFSEMARYTAGIMVNLVQQACPNLKKADAMRHLLISNLHMGLACAIDSPSGHSENENKSGNPVDGPSRDWKSGKDQDCNRADSSHINKDGLCEQNIDAPLDSDVGLLTRFNLTPILASRLRKNVVTIAAAYCPSMEAPPERSHASPNSLESNVLCKEPDWEDSDLLRFMVGCSDNVSLEDWLESESDDPKNMVILSLVKQIKEVKVQVKERKEWAHKKVMQAANKLSNDLLELKILRMEKEEKERLPKIDKQALEKESTERLLKVKNALKQANRQVDLATTAAKRLETQNSEIRADVEACKLSASESDKTFQEVAKRERKCLKRLMALGKQNSTLQEEIEEQKKKILQLHQELLQLKKAQEEAEVKWRQEMKEKEVAFSLVQEENKSKEAAEVNLKRKQASLHQKMEMDCQRMKDDMHRLEQELSYLQMSPHSRHTPFQGILETAKSWDNTIEVMPPESYIVHDSAEEKVFCYRECLICSKNEASIVFLPCAHQVLCANCNEDHCKITGATCLCCQVRIGQRIHVYGASS